MATSQTDYYNFAAGNVNIVTTAETVVGSTRPMSSAYASQQVFLQFGFQLTIGTAATSCVIKIERGTVAGGTAIHTSGALTVVAGQINLFTVAATDSQAGDVAGQIYVVTVTMGAATGNSTAANVWSAVTVG